MKKCITCKIEKEYICANGHCQACNKKRRDDDFEGKIVSVIKTHISNYLIANDPHTIDQKWLWNNLPFTTQQLIDHLKNGFDPWMTEKNYGTYYPKFWDDNDNSTWKWQVGHNFTYKQLPFNSIGDDNFSKYVSFDNWKPISAKQNFYNMIEQMRHTKRKRDFITDYTKEHIANTYAKYETLYEAAKELNVAYEELKSFMIENNLPYITRQKYTCDHDFFSRDDEKCFYWAGFIAADGNVSKNRLMIELAVKDIGHLEKWKAAIQSTAPITTYEKTDDRPEFKRESYTSCRIRFNSVKIVKDLKRFNIVPNKSLTYNIPDWLIIHPLFNHFLRGLIDGDGHCAGEKNSSNMNIAGSIAATAKLAKICELYLGHFRYHIRDEKLGIIGCSNIKDNSKIINFLLKDATIWLDRKHETQLQILRMIPRKIKISKKVLEAMIKETPIVIGSAVKTYTEIGRKLGVSPSVIVRRLVEFDLYHPTVITDRVRTVNQYC